MGVISDKQESICFAVQRKLPTVSHQICQYPYLKDVAQPVCAADRHFKRELKKKVRGISDSARQAEQSLTKEAQAVVDYCFAMRTVMRDDGKYPLDPPGVKLYEKLQLIAASVERFKALYPSALLKKLSRMLAVLNVCQKEFAQLILLFSWIHQITQLLQPLTNSEEAESQLLVFVEELKHSWLPTELMRLVIHMEKITVAFAPHLFEYLTHPLLPRTNNDLERFIGRIKKSRRHITGSKNTQEFILRKGSFVATLFGLPQTHNWGDAFSQVNLHAFHHTLNRLRQTAKRSKYWHARRDVEAYLAALEQHWVPPE